MSKPKVEKLTAKEAAELLGISYATFMRRVKAGQIVSATAPNPALRKQKNQLFLRSDVDKLRGGSKSE